MKEYTYIGKIDKSKLGILRKQIITEEIILTEERFQHIINRHKNDYNLFFSKTKEVIKRPDYVIKDIKNKNTIMLIKKIDNTNIIIIIKLAVENDKKHPKNSIMTFFRIRDKNLIKLIQKNETIYKKE